MYRRCDPSHVNPVLSQEISELQVKNREIEKLLELEQERRMNVIDYTCFGCSQLTVYLILLCLGGEGERGL